MRWNDICGSIDTPAAKNVYIEWWRSPSRSSTYIFQLFYLYLFIQLIILWCTCSFQLYISTFSYGVFGTFVVFFPPPVTYVSHFSLQRSSFFDCFIFSHSFLRESTLLYNERTECSLRKVWSIISTGLTSTGWPSIPLKFAASFDHAARFACKPSLVFYFFEAIGYLPNSSSKSAFSLGV
jgi:hypothetical protein